MFENGLEKMMDLVKNYKWQSLVASLVLFGGLGFLWLQEPVASRDQTNLEQVVLTSDEPEEEVEETRTSAEAVPNSLMVDVKGAVTAPGIYELPDGARIHDAVKAAGGMLETADPKSVNLAQKLSDEAVVYVATKEEGLSVVSATPSVSAADVGNASGTQNKVNLNTATETDLQTISGIGAKRAADIIAYRDSNGGFKSVDDLNNVSGIGDKTLENLRPHVTVD